MKLVSMFLVIAFSVSSQAVMFEKYGTWKDKPEEKFSGGEESFKLAMDKLTAGFVDKGLTKDDLYRAATAGMLEALNAGEHSWNTLLTPRELKEIESDLSGQVTGIGLNLKFNDNTGNGEILDVIPSTPAAKSGLKREDQILSVNGQRFKGRGLVDMVGALRGKLGDTVSMKVLRDDQIISVKMKREVVPWTPVELSALDKSVVLSIGYFTGDTPKLVEAKMARINAAKSVVIDLRNNSGGIFDKAVDTASLFIPKGQPIVSTRNRDGKVETYKSTRGLMDKDVKVVLLTNAQTSSGAELFAGALRDQLGAKIVGEKTLGKWNAQRIESLPNGFAIKYTTQSFETPSGASYQNVGMKPDVEVAMTVEPREVQMKYEGAKRLQYDPQLRAATELIRAM